MKAAALIDHHRGEIGESGGEPSLDSIVAAVGHRLTRAWVYALAAGGGSAVSHVLALLVAEIRLALSLTGCTRVRDISQEMLAQDDFRQAVIHTASLSASLESLSASCSAQ